MATLLIKAVDATHPNAAKDARACYKRGDLIGVAPDNWQWGTLELLPPAQGGKFVRIVISDVTRAQVFNWIRNHWGVEADRDDKSATINSVVVRRRRVHINWTALPAGVRSQLNQNGVFTTTWAQIREYVRNKATAATAAGSAIE